MPSVMPMLRVRADEFALLECALDRGLLGLVEYSIVIGVILRDLAINLSDMIHHHLSVRLHSVGRRVSWELDRAICNGPAKRCLFRFVKFAVLVRVKRREGRKGFGEMFHRCNGVGV